MSQLESERGLTHSPLVGSHRHDLRHDRSVWRTQPVAWWIASSIGESRAYLPGCSWAWLVARQHAHTHATDISRYRPESRSIAVPQYFAGRHTPERCDGSALAPSPAAGSRRCRHRRQVGG